MPASTALGAGGEYSSAISFVYEHSPWERRSRNVSMLLSTTFIGISIGSIFARICSSLMSEHAYQTYGWRILFLLALPMAVLGVYLRSHVEETPEFREIVAAREKARQEATPLRDAIRSQWPAMLVFVMATASYALISSTITSYLTTFLTDVNDMTKTQAYNATIASNVVLIIATLAMGSVCDRLGLRKTLMAAAVVVAVLAFRHRIPGGLQRHVLIDRPSDRAH
jgi:MHS family proline/betaine transporter-like MFS transporter